MKFGSVTVRLGLKGHPRTRHVHHARVGDVVLVEVLTENPKYPYLEQPSGVLTRLRVGDQVVGAIGSRQALRGFVGYAPVKLNENDELYVLNMGGVIGRFIDSTTELGEPVKVKYLGTVVDDRGIVNLERAALPPVHALTSTPPIVLVIGTCMNVGKTSTAARLIEVATRAGFKVGAAKLSGVAAVRDLRKFEDAGAVDVKSFLDAGLPSTVDTEDLAPVVKSVVSALQGDLIVVELGDGIMGHYKVETVLTDANIMSRVSAVVVCANDLMAAYGAKLYLDQLGVKIHAFSGLATENVSGSEYIEDRLGIPAINGLKNPWKLLEALNLPCGSSVRS